MTSLVDVSQAAQDAAAKVNPSIVGFGGATGYGHLCKAFAKFEQEIRLTAEQAKGAEIERLQEALAWYGEQARLARLIHSEGDAGRNALAADGGQRARTILNREGTDGKR